MLYIHTLKDLNPKSAEIECVTLLREVKRKNDLPLSVEHMKEQLSLYFVSKTDLDSMFQSLNLIPATVQKIVDLSKGKGDYEIINISRACYILKEIPSSLEKNIEYANSLFEWQESFIAEVTDILNKLPFLSTTSDKMMYESKIKAEFKKILRVDNNFVFNYNDIIHEGHTSKIANLIASMNSGFFFHVKLEEHLKKDFNAAVSRIPPEELQKIEEIKKEVNDIKKGVDRAYEVNMRMVNLAVILFAFIKWMKGK